MASAACPSVRQVKAIREQFGDRRLPATAGCTRAAASSSARGMPSRFRANDGGHPDILRGQNRCLAASRTRSRNRSTDLVIMQKQRRSGTRRIRLRKPQKRGARRSGRTLAGTLAINLRDGWRLVARIVEAGAELRSSAFPPVSAQASDQMLAVVQQQQSPAASESAGDQGFPSTSARPVHGIRQAAA